MSKIGVSKERGLVELMAYNLKMRCYLLGYITERDISDKIGMARSTYRNRCIAPETWRMIEFARAAIATGTTLEWLCAEHT